MAFQFINTGCTLLDNSMGGGVALGRMCNIVGDPSTGKTQIAIELCANFLRQYPNGRIGYCDAEAAFEPDYAFELGCPIDDISFCQKDKNGKISVQTWSKDLGNFIKSHPTPDPEEEMVPGLYILDSLDMLPMDDWSEEMLKGNIPGFAAAKRAELIGQVLKTQVQFLELKNIALVVICHAKDKMNSLIPGIKTYSGGSYPKFTASQQLLLKHIGVLNKTVDKNKIAYGIRVFAKVAKNKCGRPLLTCEFEIIAKYGIDDLMSNLTWLKAQGKLERLPEEIYKKETIKKNAEKEEKEETSDGEAKEDKGLMAIAKKIRSLEVKKKRDAIETVRKITDICWREQQEKVDNSIPRGKYADGGD